ncbi:HTH-type transcriptional regulator MgrA [anaerobic digester metagenome]|nr:MarR family transcriptional regulator [Clostridiaceae bacterium HFYG-1003]
MVKTELCGLVSVIHRKTQIYLNSELKKYGLNSAEFVYLIHIREHEPTELKSLGAHLRMDDAQTTRVIKSLEEKGLVRKLRSRTDRRAFDVEFTQAGRDVKPLILEDLDRWVSGITEGLPEQEVEEMIRLLRQTAQRAVSLTEGK